MYKPQAKLSFINELLSKDIIRHTATICHDCHTLIALLPNSPVIISLYFKQIATEMVLMQYCIDVCTI